MHRKIAFTSQDFLRGKTHLVIHPDEIKEAFRRLGVPLPQKLPAPKVMIKSPESLVRRVGTRETEWALIERGVTIMTKKETFAPKKQIHPSGFLV